MGVQALSGVAKDLTKMSSKSAVKLVAGEGSLFRLVAILTGSKNALKGVGFFIGTVLLSWLGYDEALIVMAVVLVVVLGTILAMLRTEIGKAKRKAPLRSIMSKSTEINRLSAARVFLFGSRDIWFVVALPIFLTESSAGRSKASAPSWRRGSSATAASSPSRHGSRATTTSARRAGGRSGWQVWRPRSRSRCRSISWSPSPSSAA
jgi:hypothetical protein